MKKLVIFLGALALVFSMMASAQATSFSETINSWSAYGGGDTYKISQGTPFIYQHSLPGADITDASLGLRFIDDENDSYNYFFLVWDNREYVNAAGSYLGEVDTGTYTIALNAAALDYLPALSITIDVFNNAGTADVLLDWSEISGNYQVTGGNNGGNNENGTSPVPEPATMLLLGSGLAGLAGLRKKFKK